MYRIYYYYKDYFNSIISYYDSTDDTFYTISYSPLGRMYSIIFKSKGYEYIDSPVMGYIATDEFKMIVNTTIPNRTEKLYKTAHMDMVSKALSERRFDKVYKIKLWL